jgi:hypothetical protein
MSQTFFPSIVLEILSHWISRFSNFYFRKHCNSKAKKQPSPKGEAHRPLVILGKWQMANCNWSGWNDRKTIDSSKVEGSIPPRFQSVVQLYHLVQANNSIFVFFSAAYENINFIFNHVILLLYSFVSPWQNSACPAIFSACHMCHECHRWPVEYR